MTTVFALAALAALPACDRPAPPPQRTPMQTVQALLDARAAGDYQRMAPLIVPERSGPLIRTLMAVDDFLSANRALGRYVRDQFGYGQAQMIDQSYLVENLEIFSRHVELIDEQIEGDIASVSVKANDQMPLRRARLVRDGGEWRYDPGPGESAQWAEAFKTLAAGLRQVLEDLKSGRISHQAIDDDPEVLAREVILRLTPGARLLPTSQPSDD